jgi:acyl-CoA synthetase (AMP-forming)/AMP-acid ligase II
LNILAHLSAANAAPALVFRNRALSYGEMAGRVAALAQRMAGGKRLVAIEAQPCADFVVSYLAALTAGHAVALLPPGDAEATAIFQRDFTPEISFARVGDDWRMRETAANTRGDLHPELAVMLATSGSEGRPRWVRLSRANIEANAASIATYLGLTASDRAAQTLPFHYSYGLSVLHAHLAAGGSLAFCGDSVIADGFLDTAARLGCTGIAGVPYSFELLERLSLRARLWPELRYMTSAGGRLPADLVARYAAAMADHGGQFFVMYGQTEATARMAYLPPDQALAHPDCIGIAIPGGQFRIAAAPGSEGELHYRGPNVMMGYAADRSDLARGPELDELATGDIAVMTEAGLIRLVGRASRFSKIAGLRIGHEAVEWALGARGIACAVTGSDGMVTVHTEGADGEDVRSLAAAAAGLPARCVAVRHHASLPRLISGKMDYRSLADAERPAAGPGDLLQDFRAAFYPRLVTTADSFESLDGDSLAYVQVSVAIENRLGGLPQDWETLPIATLAQRAAGRAVQQASALGRIESHMVLRAATILLIVVHHATLWPIPGGAAALLVMVGYGFARFHREALFAGRAASLLMPMLRNLLPYLVIVAGFALAWGTIPWASVLLIGNFGFASPVDKTMLPFQFWFVEAYAQLCLATAAAFSVPAVREVVRRNPFATALGLLLAAFALRYAVPLVYDVGGRKMFMLSYVLWLPAMGWCAYFAGDVRRKLLLLAVAGTLCCIAAYTGGNWRGSWILYMIQFGVVGVLVGLPAVWLPRLVLPAVMLISAASYHIYLFHRIVPELLGLDDHGAFGIIASIALGIVSGIGAMLLQRMIFAGLGRRASLSASGA